jgi:hypothetical protein
MKFRERRASGEGRHRSDEQGETDHKQRPAVTLKRYSAGGDFRRRAGKRCAKENAQYAYSADHPPSSKTPWRCDINPFPKRPVSFSLPVRFYAFQLHAIAGRFTGVALLRELVPVPGHRNQQEPSLWRNTFCEAEASLRKPAILTTDSHHPSRAVQRPRERTHNGPNGSADFIITYAVRSNLLSL